VPFSRLPAADNRKRRTVLLCQNASVLLRSNIGKEYSISVTAIRNWVKNYGNSGSFKRKDNMSEIEKENSELKKLVKQQQMELDILKKAMALMLKS